MENITYSDMQKAIDEAEATIKRAETFINKMAEFITPRLHRLSPYRLKILKKELSKYISRTGEWK